MSVVDPAIQFPSDWVQASKSIGVIRDGNLLRLWFQPQKGHGTPVVCSMEEWPESDAKQNFLREVDQGALVIAGLSPDRGLVRECSSPLSNLEKSAEIWPSLLDAALPFPLEDCEVAFLPPVTNEKGGAHCIAAAARQKDMDQALQEWAELDIAPDVLIPEVLLLSEHQKSTVWIGKNRCMYTAWEDGHFLGAGASAGAPSASKAFSRFKTAWKIEHPDMKWEEVGPGAENPHQQEILEKNAACSVFLKQSCFMNILRNSEGGVLQKKLGRTQRHLGILAGIYLVLLLASPFFVRGLLRGVQDSLQEEIEMEYVKLVGEESTQRGMEVLLATRYAEESMQEVLSAQTEVSGPAVTNRIHRVLEALERSNLIATSLRANPHSVSVSVLANEEQLDALESEFTFYGDEMSYSPTTQGEWRLEVRKP